MEEYVCVVLGKFFGCIYVLLQILEVVGVQLFVDYVVLQKVVFKFSYVLINLFCFLYLEGFCLIKEEESEVSGMKFEEVDGIGMGEGEG